MRAQWILLFLAVCMHVPCMATADQASATVEQKFSAAVQAYDEGRYGEAIEGFQATLNEGLTAPEVHYDLGNAYFKTGAYPEAILCYLRARLYMPNDSELLANLDFSLQQVNAVPVDHPLWFRSALLLSAKQWMTLSLLFFWLAFLLLAVGFFWPQYQKRSLRLSFWFFFFTLSAAAPLTVWIHAYRFPDVVIVKDTAVRYAPLDQSPVHYELPAGSVIQMSEQNGEWMKVSRETKAGWVHANSAIPVIPLNRWPNLDDN